MQSMHASDAPQRVAHCRQSALLVTRISVGEKRARIPKAASNGSPCRSHAGRPNRSMPVHVISEYTVIMSASFAGTVRPE